MSNAINGYTYFVWTNGTNSSYGFTGYTDRNGDVQGIILHNDERGKPIYRRFQFRRSNRTLSIPNTQEKVIEFLRNHPECELSPNGHYREDDLGNKVQFGISFKELNSGKDAEIVIDATEKKVEATSIVLSYKAAIKEADKQKVEELKDLATLCGNFSADPMLQLHYVLQFAENSPDKFMDIYNDPYREARALVNEGLESGNPFLKRKGFMIFWQDIHLGNDVDQAVKKLVSDPILLKGIKDNAKKHSR